MTKIEVGESLLPYYHQAPREMYCVIYFKAYNNIINAIKDRFHLPDSKIYEQLRNTYLFSLFWSFLVKYLKLDFCPTTIKNPTSLHMEQFLI